MLEIVRIFNMLRNITDRSKLGKQLWQDWQRGQRYHGKVGEYYRPLNLVFLLPRHSSSFIQGYPGNAHEMRPWHVKFRSLLHEQL